MGADSNAFTSDDLTVYHILAGKAGAAQDRRDRGRSLPAPHYEQPDFQKEARAVLGEYNKNASNPMEKMVETLYDHAFTHAHLQAHDDGLPEGHREHAQRVRLLAAVLRPLLPARERGPPGRRRRRPGGGLQAGRGALRRLEGGRPRTRPSPSSRRRRRRSAPTLDLEGPDAADAARGATTRPAFSTTNVDVPTLDVLAELLFAERAPLYKRLVIKEQKVESHVGLQRRPRRSQPVHRVRAHQEAAATSATSRRPIHDEMAAHRATRASTTPDAAPTSLSHVKYAFAGQLSTADKTATTASSFIALTGDWPRSTATSRSTTRSPAPTSSASPPAYFSPRTAPSSPSRRASEP